MLKFLGSLLLAIVGAIVACFVVKHLLEKEDIIARVKNKCDNAFYAQIQEKKKHSVKVGIFDNENECFDSLEIHHEAGISDALTVGRKIYI